ncbi:MAG TPA: peptidoglycan-binding protein [Terriglobia bacterium]|jgi:murein DD-endopeptidase MepM/ murein hydrolase activator NlpD
MKQHIVQPGECLTSIAARYGFSQDMIWNLSDNSALKEKRTDPNTLVPGDVIAIPDRREKLVSCETAQTHRFKLSAPSALFRLQMFEDEKALANLDFELKIGEQKFTGTTDGSGVLEVTIPSTASEGVLTIGPDKDVYELRFGQLQPITEKQGVEARLRNLGFVEDSTEKALRAFQKRFGLTETGEADQATMDKLVDVHDKVCDFPEHTSQETSQTS